MADDEATEANSAEGESSAEEALSGSEGLSQDEIDSLLGFASGDDHDLTGVQALLARSLQTYERLPMLEVVFDRFVRSLSTALRNYTSESVDVSVESIISMRFEDYLNSVPLPALMAIFQSVEWENYGIITIDSALIYTMVDVLLGGGKANKPAPVEGRPFTTIEQDLIQSLSKLMLEEMSNAFNPLTPATFRLERLETNPRFATITRPANPVSLISLRVNMDDRGGKVDILIPYATLEPVKDLLTQMFSGESFGGPDVSWEDDLGVRIRDTELEMEAVLMDKEITLRELAELKVGDTVVMKNTPQDEVALRCKGIKMVRGMLGASGKKLAVSVSHVYDKSVTKMI